MGRKGIETRIQEEARCLCKAISNLNGEPFDPLHHTNAAVSNIICSITFGRRFEYDDPVFIDLIRRLRRLTGGVGINPIIRELISRFPFLLKSPLMKRSRDNLMGLKVITLI